MAGQVKINLAKVLGLGMLCLAFAPSPLPAEETHRNVVVIEVDHCDVTWMEDGGVIMQVTFRNMLNAPVSAIEFQFLFRNSVGELLHTEEGTVEGVFAPGVEIKPRKYMNQIKLYDEDSHSPAWRFDWAPQNTREITCKPEVVRLQDGRVFRTAQKYAE